MKKNKFTCMVLVVALIGIIALLGACTAKESKQSNQQVRQEEVVQEEQQVEQTEQVEAGEQARSEPQTKVFKHELGETEVPVHPKRVASDQYMGQLLKLGIKPVAVRDNMLLEPWIELANLEAGALDSVEGLGGFPLDLEGLVLQDPDLIISSLPDNVDSYSKIASTVHIPYVSLEYSSPMDKFLKIADLFDKTKEAQEWIDEFGQEAAKVREQIMQSGKIEPGETVSVMAAFDQNIYIFGPKGSYGGSMIYDYLDLEPTSQAEELRGQTFNSAALSFEMIPEYMGDHAFITVVNKEMGEALMESSFWKVLPAVVNDQVYFYESSIFAMDDPFSMEAQLHIIRDLLLSTP